MTNGKSKIYIGFSTRMMILSILLVFSIIMAVVFFVGATETDIKQVVANSSSNIDYKVHLKDNSYYETNVLDADMQYIASLIDYIDTDFEYNITSTLPVDYNYSYYIEAVTKVYGDSTKSKVLFEKSKILLEEKTLTATNTDNVAIKENIKIDYNEYNMLIASFKTSYSLTSVSDVTVILHVKATGKEKTIKTPITIDEKAELVVPLTEQTVDVQITKNSGYSDTFVDGDSKFVINNKYDFVLSIICILITIVILVRLMTYGNMTNKSNNTKYKKTLRRILKEYDLIIASVSHEIDENNYEVITMRSFEELKDIHDNIGSPILFNEIHKGQKSNFIIVKDNFLYKYVLKSVDLENK